ncbi:hypothetical protein E2562_026136 [Oryza meyeriana var. granulata]|uniref:Uncharacterized protein n=1 Tax=Oryza meyeriana var. granulata TaxID=110450 RepID=A0A6G1FCM1_9ORYZ|nr:hypothetical protein E2562_026136 [Oryza meyeriana var. granulata]
MACMEHSTEMKGVRLVVYIKTNGQVPDVVSFDTLPKKIIPFKRGTRMRKCRFKKAKPTISSA